MEINEIAAAQASVGDNADLREAINAHINQDLSTAEVYYRRILRKSPDSRFVKYVLAHLLYDRREHLDESLQLLRAITASEPNNLSFRLLHGKVCAELRQWDEAIVSFRTVNENSPRVPDAYTHLRRPMVVSGRALELVRILDDVQRRFPDIEVGRLSGFIPEQRAAIAREIPSILLITMPKSGSVYTAMRLSEVLDAPQCRISLDLIPVDHVIPSWVESFAMGGAVCQEHLDASTENLQILAASGVKKLQIHLRDPRQATLSWVHHVETMIGENAYLRDLLSPLLPDGYDEFLFSRKIDWHIDNHLPTLVKWTSIVSRGVV